MELPAASDDTEFVFVEEGDQKEKEKEDGKDEENIAFVIHQVKIGYRKILCYSMPVIYCYLLYGALFFR